MNFIKLWIDYLNLNYANFVLIILKYANYFILNHFKLNYDANYFILILLTILNFNQP